ncbi:MAG: bifunctional folylpolyglutamate synthase/dihydrofolate synthase [Oscillospiraceae bacterium]|nr:bifunctional folylpolyglutamate synthase/dihydrofolate synthase [Oscillospiraceae bacterium]
MKNYTETLDYIRSLGKYSNPPHKDLSKIHRLCALFDNPQDSYRTIHIAGTNGKGSTAAMLSAAISEFGYKTGRFISPYIENFTERISVNGADISEGDIVYYAQKIKNTIEKNQIPEKFMPNEFDFVTLIAFLYYRQNNCDIAVIETGLGGRIDPTNSIKSPLASVITSISLDHMQYLGDTIEKIAAEKCGIIKDNSPVVLYPLNRESVIQTAKNTAYEKNCEFIIPDIKELEILEEKTDRAKFKYKKKLYEIKLAGRHQIYNALTVIETIFCVLKDKTGLYEALCRGLQKTSFPARFETLSREPLVIIDGAHNISGVETLRETIKNLLPDKKITLVCAMMKDKNPEEVIKQIAGENFVKNFIGVPVGSPRAEEARKLCEIAKKYCANAWYGDDLSEIVADVFENREFGGPNSAVIFFGSLYLAGEVKKILKEIQKINT